MLKNWNDRWKSSAVLALLVLCAVIPYANTLLNGFVSDDNGQILENPYIRSWGYLSQIFSTSVWSFTGVSSHYYRPMMTLGYLLCYKLFGLSPASFHLVNIALHATIVCILFFLTRRVFGDQVMAFGTAVVFAFHPIHTESVNWIAAVTDLELTCFYLCTFWLFVDLDRFKGWKLILAYSAMMISFAAALLSKEQALTLPFVASVYEHLYRDKKAATSWIRSFLRCAPLWLLAIAYLPLRLWALGGFVVTSNYWGLTVSEVIFSAIASTGQYVWKLIWPLELCAFYVFKKSDSMLDLRVIGGALFALLLCAVFWQLWKRARLISFGIIWMMATLAPALNPKWLGVSVVAERYLYLPSVGFCWMLAWGLQQLWRDATRRQRIWRQVLAMALSLVALLAGFRIVTRNSDWHDDLVLATQTLEVSPDSSIFRLNLATIYQNEGLLKMAEDEYREGLRRDPQCSACLSHLGMLLLDEGRSVEAKSVLTRSLQLDPRDVTAHLNLGSAYQRAGIKDNAEQEFQTAAGLEPRNIRVHTILGSFYLEQGDHRRAENSLKYALLLNPYNIPARIMLGKVYESEHRPTEAIREFQAVIANQPSSPEAVLALRRLRVTQN